MKTEAPNFLALVVATATSAVAQVVTPVWVEHVNGLVNVDPANKLPILVKAGGTGDNTYSFDGTDVIDSYAKFLKYDDDHYLLGIRENGINEGDPGLSQELKDRAAAYPDRSIIWIDAHTGKPLGIALKTEVFPASLGASSQSTTHGWWKWGISDGANGQRVIYTGYKYKVLRYAPSGTVADPNFPAGKPTWSTTPTEAWVEPVPDEPNPTIPPYVDRNDPAQVAAWVGSSGGDGSASWRLKAFRVTGSGSNTKIFAGGATWRSSMHEQEFVTADGGLTFYPVGRLNDRGDGCAAKGFYSLGGEPSSIRTNTTGLAWCIQGHYPGTGWEARPGRYVENSGGTNACSTNEVWWKCTTCALGNSQTNLALRANYFDPVEGAVGDLPAFKWEAAGKDGKPINHKLDGVQYYDGNWVLTSDTKDGVDYIVTYAIPSWNQQFGGVGPNWPTSIDTNSTFKPGWIGLHTMDGKISTGDNQGQNNAYKIPVYETDEPILDPNGNGGTGHDYGYDGDVEVYPDSDGKGGSLILWSGAIYGFGVFRAQNVPAAITQQTAPLSATKTEGESITFTAAASGGANLYHWLKDSVPIPGATATNYTIDRLKLADSGKYRLQVINRLGNVETSDANLTVVVDNVPPTIKSVTAGENPTKSAFWVTIEFSERVTSGTATNRTNYGISGGVTISEVVMNSETTITLNTSALTDGTEYTLTVNGVKDQSVAGNVIATDTQKKFTLELTAGYGLWEFYPNITGTRVDLLTSDGNYPDNPSRREFLTLFSTIPQFTTDFDSNFGARVSGWLTPAASGNYHFFIRSDDSSELWLSSTNDPSSKTLVAQETSCCHAFLEPTDMNNTGQTTATPIALVAGAHYYIEALYKEGGGGDYVEVAWRKEGDATPAANLTPIPGSLLSTYRSAGAPKFSSPIISAGNITIGWTGSGTLQESTDLSNWNPVSGNPASGFQVTPAAGEHKFYRLAQ